MRAVARQIVVSAGILRENEIVGSAPALQYDGVDAVKLGKEAS
jgi:hypothetical protein